MIIFFKQSQLNIASVAFSILIVPSAAAYLPANRLSAVLLIGAEMKKSCIKTALFL
ncbi:hypothetical protein [Bacillus sp. YAF8]|uniref:hypothetical protein n=1 Tax=Bacillus sp. YAF8 TaxID=3237485 RepID=UPI003F917D8D